MKKRICLILTAALLLIPSIKAGAWHSFRNETGLSQTNITSAKTPTDTLTSGPKWRIKFSQSTKSVCNSVPVLTEDHIFIVCENTLFKLDTEGNILSRLSLDAPMNSVCYMALHENKLFIPLGGGMLQCVDTTTMSSLWKSETFGLQSLTAVCVYDGYVYAGTTNPGGTDGLYYCLRETDGQTVWTYKNEVSCGYYWSGAVPANIEDEHTADALQTDSPSTKCLLFGGDNGRLISHSLTEDTVYDVLDLSEHTGSAGKIRAGITYDPETDAYYITSNDGYLYKITLTADGHFNSVTPAFLGDTPSVSANCTSTPVVYNSRIYVCSYYQTAGLISVVDAISMERIYAVTSPELHDIKSSPLVSTGYASEENDQNVYVYFTQNAVPGGIYYIKDNARAAASEIQTLYEPKNNPQFCMASIVAGPDGTLYYSNDSGTLFAIAEGFSQNDTPPSPSVTEAPDIPPQQEPAASQTQSPTGAPFSGTGSENPLIRNNAKDAVSKTGSTVRPGKPKNIKLKKKQKPNGTYKVTLFWKKGANTTKTLLKIKEKKSRLVSGAKTTFLLKKGTYTIRLYGYRPGMKKSPAVRFRFKLAPPGQ